MEPVETMQAESTAPQSDESILGIDDGAPNAVETPEAAPVADETTQQVDGEKPAEVDPAQAAQAAEDAANMVGKLDLRRVPEKLRQMAREDEGLRTLLLQELAWRDLGMNVDDAKALKEKLPEGVKTLEDLQTSAQEAKDFDTAFYSKDPAQQTPALEKMMTTDPEAFASAFRASSQLLATKQPEVYAKLSGELLTGTLKNAGFEQFGQALNQAVASGDTEAIKGLAGEMAKWLQGYGIAQPKEDQLAARERAIAEREQASATKQESDAATQFQKFNQDVGVELSKRNNAMVEEAFGKVVPDQLKGSPMVSVAMKQIASELDTALKTDAELHGQIAAMLRPEGVAVGVQIKMAQILPKLTPATQTKITDMLAAKAKTLLVSIAKPYITDLQTRFVTAQNDKNAKSDKAASRVDVGSTGGAPASAKPLKPGDPKLRGLTDEQILDL